MAAAAGTVDLARFVDLSGEEIAALIMIWGGYPRERVLLTHSPKPRDGAFPELIDQFALDKLMDPARKPSLFCVSDEEFKALVARVAGLGFSKVLYAVYVPANARDRAICDPRWIYSMVTSVADESRVRFVGLQPLFLDSVTHDEEAALENLNKECDDVVAACHDWTFEELDTAVRVYARELVGHDAHEKYGLDHEDFVRRLCTIPDTLPHWLIITVLDRECISAHALERLFILSLEKGRTIRDLCLEYGRGVSCRRLASVIRKACAPGAH